ncbi:L,D-transpeptidase family protein [Spirosoma koreense]
MLRGLTFSLWLLPLVVNAQLETDWIDVRMYAHSIGIDAPCEAPETSCLKAYFIQIVYGKTDRYLGYQGLSAVIDTTRINRLVEQFRAGTTWRQSLDSLESHDANYRALKDYYRRCLTDDYMADSLTLEQVKSSLNVYRWLNRFPADKRVIVNIPSASLRVIDRQGNTVLSSRVIVGKATTPTPCFTARITNLITYPYWNVPHSIAVQELLPRIRRNPSAVLAQMKLQILDNKGHVIAAESVNWPTVTSKTFPYRFRQSTGCDNALGVMKFTINNPYDIYLHDTNQRALFAREQRALSHGCIRVEKPIELANLLLGYKRFSPHYLTTCATKASPQMVDLPNAVPIIVTYTVIDIDEMGAVQHYIDVYGWWQLAL